MTVLFDDPAATLPVGARWVLDVVTLDDDGDVVAGAPAVVVTLPDGSTTSPVVTLTDAGRYRAVYVPAVPGRYLVAATSALAGAATIAGWVLAATTTAGMPTAGDVVDYMGPTSHPLADVDDALLAETDAQRAVCNVGAYLTHDLRHALLRRVQRNLTMRRLPLAVLQGDAEAGSSTMMPPGRDPEVRRLEGPYRRMPIG